MSSLGCLLATASNRIFLWTTLFYLGGKRSLSSESCGPGMPALMSILGLSLWGRILDDTRQPYLAEGPFISIDRNVNSVSQPIFIVSQLCVW